MIKEDSVYLSIFISTVIVFLVLIGLDLIQARNVDAQVTSCVVSDLADALITSPRGIAGLGNPEGICIVGAPAYQGTDLAKIRVDTYEDFYAKYYVGADEEKRTTAALTLSSATPLEIRQNMFFRVNGDLTINSGAFTQLSPLEDNKIAIFFVERNLNINSDITYGDIPPADLNDDNMSGGLIFVVRGQINILPTVRQINGVLMASGESPDTISDKHSICTACQTNPNPNSLAGEPPYAYNYSQYDPRIRRYDIPLVINGSVVSLNPFRGQGGSLEVKQIKFYRKTSNIPPAGATTFEPSETINAQPKYLYLLKGMISDNYKRWRELL